MCPHPGKPLLHRTMWEGVPRALLDFCLVGFLFCLFCFYEKCCGISFLHCVEGNKVSVALQTPAAVLHRSVGGEGTEELIHMCYGQAITVRMLQQMWYNTPGEIQMVQFSFLHCSEELAKRCVSHHLKSISYMKKQQPACEHSVYWHRKNCQGQPFLDGYCTLDYIYIPVSPNNLGQRNKNFKGV